jgi:hypothetical protein
MGEAGIVTQSASKLEARARATGLLGEGHRITHAKAFKKAKKSLGIRSVRNGFGDGGEWLWRLEMRPASPVSKPVPIEDTYAEAQADVHEVGVNIEYLH